MVLTEVSRAFVRLGDLAAAIEMLVKRLERCLLADERCVVMLLDHERRELVAIGPAHGSTATELAEVRTFRLPRQSPISH